MRSAAELAVSGELEMVFWDVQHGSATYIKTPNQRHIVQDLGTGSVSESNQTFSPLRHLRNSWGVHRLDAVIITHPHKDHLDDIFNFDAMNPTVLMRPTHISPADVWAENPTADARIVNKYFEISGVYSAGVEAVNNLTVPPNYGGVTFQFFFPQNCARSNLNNHSIVTVVTFEGFKAVLPGDNEPPSWNELLQSDNFVRAARNADVLLAPHHGRLSASSSALLDLMRPRFVFISDGPEEDTSATGWYGHYAKGGIVVSKTRGDEERKVVTTRSDAAIFLRAWRKPDGSTVYRVNVG